MSVATECFTELYEAQTDFIGTSPVVAIGSVSSVAFIIGNDDQTTAFEFGGISSTGQNTLITLTSAWTGGIPVKPQIATLTAIPGGGTITQQVISTVERSGILYITIGDNTSQ
jgi:hypothetical protein